MNYFKFFPILIFLKFSHQFDEKLPDNALPYHYDIKMFPPTNSNVFTFEGESDIFLNILKPTVNLTLHSLNLNINSKNTKLKQNGVTVMPKNHFFEVESQFLILNFENEIQPGNYCLHLEFTGEIGEGLDSNKFGFFRQKNMNRTLVSTQFKSPHARQVFPCWDEPEIKATFYLWIKRLPNQVALSNTLMRGIVDQIKEDGYMWSVFQTTPPMSTNMISIVVTDVHDDITNVDSKVVVICSKEYVNKGFYSFEFGVNTLTQLEKFIGVQYDLPKMQMLAILNKNQKPLGTCGLIITRELTKPILDNLGDNDKMISYVHIIYELARQWFGCLITPASYGDTWITEGLVFYMSHFVLNKMNLSSSVQHIRREASIDALNINLNLYKVSSAKDKTSLNNFNIKAEAVMQMISGLLTEQIFHAAIKKIVEVYKYKSITTDEFWNSLQETMNESQLRRNNFNLRMYMEPYIVQEGYPIINVVRDYSCNTIKLTQNSSIDSNDSVKQKWWVPVNIASSDTLNFTSTFATNWINPHDEKLIVDGLTHDDWWYIVNVQSTGLYRVNYDERNWNRLVDYLNSENYKNIHILNRLRIVDDILFFNGKSIFSDKILIGIFKYISGGRRRIYEIVADPNNLYYEWTYFKKTPLMSPNMVCIMVTDFHNNISNSDNTFSIDSDMESFDKAFHTLARAMNAMKLLEQYIGIKSDFPIMQLIGVLDQNEEPMGKCGVVITNLLIKPNADYLEDDREVKPYVHIIYELARQWLGCIMTPATPADTWITEGLVFYISHIILSKMDSFSVFVEFTRYRYSFYALDVDLNVYNGPTIQEGSLMNYDIEIEALMHMISGVLTENIFHSIINTIIQTYKYKTISTDQFWNTVQEEMEKSQIKRNNFNIRNYLETYILQNGHPIVNIERDYSCNTIKLKQTSSIASKGFADQNWWIPINIVGSHTHNFSSTHVNSWMNPHDEKLIVDGLTHDDWWYIVNVQSFGLYRVNYDERNWNRLVDCLNSEDFRKIHVLNRMRIVDDALYFNQENKLPQNVIEGIKKYINSKKDIVSSTRARDLLDLQY
ncbi:aminopeptidase Ey-like [Leptopilina heterotoma]|uniref:aminopeptidase Ey-like n=1 Tax=Leptopilina heterotoma TaxID=63436 RepID=UPI001CA88167|nr:aminopeptidase Ey-like [Leptopilina heterotoma]